MLCDIYNDSIQYSMNNNFIIPLYDYGVGVYDFAPDQAVAEKKVSIKEAKKTIEEYFD